MFKPHFFHPDSEIPDAPPTRRYLRTAIITISIVGALVGLASFAHSLYSEPQPISTNDTTLTPTEDTGLFGSLRNFLFTSTGGTLQGQENNRINILLLGIGGPGHDGSYLSDTNIITSIKPSSGEVAMISIPRDLMVKTEKYGYQKINAVSSYSELKNPGQGGELTRQFFAQHFNLDIPYYVRVDFQAFKDVIDAVGGIEIDIPTSFTDYRYPGPNYSYQTVSFTKGPTTLNGEKALIYSRSRHGNNGEGSDFARSRRQQQVMLALKQKLLSAGTLANPLVLKDIYDSLTEHVTTNLTFNQLVYLAGLSQKIDKNSIKNVVVDDTRNGLLIPLNNQLGDVLAPKAGNFDMINTFIRDVFSLSTQSTTPVNTPLVVSATADSITTLPPASGSTTSLRISSSSAVIDVYNGTWEVGLATRVKKYLESKGLFIRSVGNSSERPVTITSFYQLNPGVDAQFARSLAADIGAKIGSSTPRWLLPPPPTATTSTAPSLTAPDIIILLGTDFVKK